MGSTVLSFVFVTLALARVLEHLLGVADATLVCLVRSAQGALLRCLTHERSVPSTPAPYAASPGCGASQRRSRAAGPGGPVAPATDRRQTGPRCVAILATPVSWDRGRSYLRLAFWLADRGATWSLATHDGRLREALLRAHGPVTVEQLLGVRPQALRDLHRRAVPTRVYVPYGHHWFRYWMRRVAESRGA